MADEISLKVITIGDAGVGKTCLINFAVTNIFHEDYMPTIAANYSSKKVECQGQIIDLHLWDTSGNYSFQSLMPIYYRDSQIVLICFALNDVGSFVHVDNWYEKVKEHVKNSYICFLVGLKYELENLISFEEAEEKAKSLGCSYFQVSSKIGYGVNELFDAIAESALQKPDSKYAEEKKEKNVDINGEKPNEERKCC